MKIFLTKYNVFAYRDGTGTNSGLSAPVSSGFFVPPGRENILPLRRVEKAECNTRKGNKPRHLLVTVETRRLINAAKLNQQEAQMKKSEIPNPEASKMFTRVADLSHVWDCRCEIEKFSQCITALHMLTLEYFNEDAVGPFSVLLCVFAEKLSECIELLSKTLDQALEAKQ